MAVKRDNRGGKREGSGRKKHLPSARRINAMWRAAKKRSREGGRGLPTDLLLDVIYDYGTKISDRLKATEIWLKYAMVEVEGDKKAAATSPPVLEIPARREDPALRVVSSGKE